MKERLLSVGIDIGTSTTQLIFSRLTLENRASSFTVPRFSITEKEDVYRSAVHFTPLVSDSEIDADGVRDIVAREYAGAGVARGDVATGAVIITGETARKVNAQQVLSALSGFAGDFVVATAGPDLESVLAARGAGADRYSEAHACAVLNFDIGGGTSNLALFDRGALRGAGDTRSTMFIMLGSFVVFRQVYLFAVYKLGGGIDAIVLGYPAGWVLCSILLLIYYYRGGWFKKLQAGIE